MYTVVVKVELDGFCMCCGQKPEITREVTVYPLQLAVGEVLQAPAGWNPTIMPLAQFGAAPEYGNQPSAPPLA